MNIKANSIERKITRLTKRQRTQDIVLMSLYALSVLSVGVVAPNAAQLFKYVEKYLPKKTNIRTRTSQAITRLVAKGLIVRTGEATHSSLQLTKKGKDVIKVIETQQKISPQKPKRWDGKWRIVIFDVWERRRGVRNKLRIMLQNTGFMKIQNSVWVYPYPCEDLFMFLRTDLRLGQGMLYIVADEIEHDVRLRRHFGLPVSRPS